MGQRSDDVLFARFGRQIIERIIELNDSADRGQPLGVPAVMRESWDDMDEVFAAVPLHQQHRHHHQQQQQLLPSSARLNSSSAAVAANTSFDIRPTAAPPVQVRETTM